MQVKILSNEEFEALPYPEMSTSVGVADPKTRTAYVRDTGLPILDAFNLAHELEHLKDGHEGVYADHYRNGVYYKGFGDILRTVAPIGGALLGGPILGPLFASGFGIPALGLGAAGTAAGAGAGGALAGAGAEATRKPQGQPQQQSMSQGMGGEQPITESFRPSVEQPNVIQAGGGQGVGIGDAGLNHQGAGAIERVRGFFSGRNPL